MIIVYICGLGIKAILRRKAITTATSEEQRNSTSVTRQNSILTCSYSKDGGLSTEATVEDGGQDDPEKDETYKPS